MRLAVIIVKPWKKLDKDTHQEVEEFDKEGVQKEYIIYEPVAGEVPAGKNIMRDIIAKSNYFEVGKKYEVLIKETGTHPEYGRQFRFENKGEWLQSVKAAIAEYGEPVYVDTRKEDVFLTIS